MSHREHILFQLRENDLSADRVREPVAGLGMTTVRGKIVQGKTSVCVDALRDTLGARDMEASRNDPDPQRSCVLFLQLFDEWERVYQIIFGAQRLILYADISAVYAVFHKIIEHEARLGRLCADMGIPAADDIPRTGIPSAYLERLLYLITAVPAAENQQEIDGGVLIPRTAENKPVHKRKILRLFFGAAREAIDRVLDLSAQIIRDKRRSLLFGRAL